MLAEWNDDSIVISSHGEIHRLIELLSHFAQHPQVKITALEIQQVEDRQVMTIRGTNLDFDALDAVLRGETDAPQSQGNSPKRSMAMSTAKAADELAKQGKSEGFLGPVRVEAIGETIVMRGKKKDVDRVSAIINGIERLARTSPDSETESVDPEAGKSKDQGPERVTVVSKQLPAGVAAALFEQLVTLQKRREEMAKVFLPSHPSMRSNQKQIQSIAAELAISADSTEGLGPFRIEVLEDIFMVRGRKEDVDRVMKLMREITQPSELASNSAKQEAASNGHKKDALLRLVRLSDSAKSANIQLALSSYLEGKGIDQETSVELETNSNLLIIRASRANFEAVVDFLKKRSWLDTSQKLPADEQSQFHVYNLKNALAAQLQEVLKGFYRDLQGADVQVRADVERNRILVRAPGKLQTQIAKMIQELDQAPRRSEYIATYRPTRFPAQAVHETLRQMFGKAQVKIAADVEANQLIVRGSQDEHEMISELLSQIDATPADTDGAKLDDAKASDATGKLVTKPGLVGPSHAQESPDKKAVLQLAHGRSLYKSNCSHCHGTTGRGDGKTAASLDPPPRDFTSQAFASAISASAKSHAPTKDIAAVIKTGIAASAMPSFAQLGAGDRSALAAYVRYLAGPPSGPGKLRFPLEIERAMMSDVKLPSSKNISR